MSALRRVSRRLEREIGLAAIAGCVVHAQVAGEHLPGVAEDGCIINNQATAPYGLRHDECGAEICRQGLYGG
jgi:hypothetical protein